MKPGIRFALAVLTLVGCSKTSNLPPPGAAGSIGAAGGTVSASDGSSVQIPAGALSAPVQISATSTPNAPTPAQVTVVGTPVTLGPEGQQFQQPVTVTLVFSPDKVPAGGQVVVYTAPQGSTRFTSLGGTVIDATHVQATTTHFSVFEAGVATTSAGSCAACVEGRCADSCPSGFGACQGGRCTDLQNDPQNCGACGNACPSGQGCAQGACAPRCGGLSAAGCGGSAGPGGTITCSSPCSACGSTCAALQEDPQNCGACGNVCPSGQVCTNGACGPPCPSGEVCALGVCAASCPSGSTNCGGLCVDTQADPRNCGGCGTACPNGQACAQGVCAQTCGLPGVEACPASGGPGQVTCGGGCSACGPGCADFSNDPRNCGACGNACAMGEVCRNGACTTPCPSGQLCAGGVCMASCPAGTAACGPRCLDVQNDSANCGGCGQACPSGQACYQGACVAGCGGSSVSGPDGGGPPNPGPGSGAGGTSGGTSGTSCPGVLCNGACTNILGDPNNCGGCGQACPSGQGCTNGVCHP
jgi:hypothetical protein